MWERIKKMVEEINSQLITDAISMSTRTLTRGI